MFYLTTHSTHFISRLYGVGYRIIKHTHTHTHTHMKIKPVHVKLYIIIKVMANIIKCHTTVI